MSEGIRTDNGSTDTEHARPPGVDDDTVEAAGKMSEALEYVERARGHLYTFHQLIGHADALLDEVCEKLRAAGHDEAAERVQTELVGHNVLHGRWSFQIVEEFDDTYWSLFGEHERRLRTEFLGGARHVFESEMKERRRTHGRKGHEATP